MARSRRAVAGAAWQTAARWTPAMARDALAELRSSGKSVAEFASSHGIDGQRLYGWRRRLAAPEHAVATFVEVVSRPRSREGAAVEIVMASGEVVRVGADADLETVARVVALLRGAPC